MHAAKQQVRVRAAAVLSKHGPTCRRVAQSLGAAGLQVRATAIAADLSMGDLDELEALLIDLDVAPGEPVKALVAEARRACPGIPVLATAGIDARARLLSALCEAEVNHVLPKRGALTLGKGELPSLGTLEGPDEQQLFAAVRRLVDAQAGTRAEGVERYLLSGAPVTEMTVRSTAQKEAALDAIMAFAESMNLAGEKRRRVELATQELLMNALYDAPRAKDGSQRHLGLDRRLPVTLEGNEAVRLRYGCDGQTLALAVADSFGALSRRAVIDGLRKIGDGQPSPRGAAPAAAGLGLVMAYSVANQLIFSVERGRSTEVTVALHVGGSNRSAQERGTAVHLYFGREG
jgi:hypothetical protein